MNRLNVASAAKCLETIEDFVKAVPIDGAYKELGRKRRYAQDALDQLYSFTKGGNITPSRGCAGKAKD